MGSLVNFKQTKYRSVEHISNLASAKEGPSNLQQQNNFETKNGSNLHFLAKNSNNETVKVSTFRVFFEILSPFMRDNMFKGFDVKEPVFVDLSNSYKAQTVRNLLSLVHRGGIDDLYQNDLNDLVSLIKTLDLTMDINIAKVPKDLNVKSENHHQLIEEDDGYEDAGFNCTRCEKINFSNRKLKIHLIEEHFQSSILKLLGIGINERKVKCEECRMVFKDRQTMAMHFAFDHRLLAFFLSDDELKVSNFQDAIATRSWLKAEQSKLKLTVRRYVKDTTVQNPSSNQEFKGKTMNFKSSHVPTSEPLARKRPKEEKQSEGEPNAKSAKVAEEQKPTEDPYHQKCVMCEREFDQLGVYKLHLVKHFREELVNFYQLKPYDFKCKVCDRDFADFFNSKSKSYTRMLYHYAYSHDGILEVGSKEALKSLGLEKTEEKSEDTFVQEMKESDNEFKLPEFGSPEKLLNGTREPFDSECVTEGPDFPADLFSQLNGPRGEEESYEPATITPIHETTSNSRIEEVETKKEIIEDHKPDKPADSGLQIKTLPEKEEKEEKAPSPQCPMCPVEKKDPAELDHHVKMHFKKYHKSDENGKVISMHCPVCVLDFQSGVHFAGHLTEKHKLKRSAVKK